MRGCAVSRSYINVCNSHVFSVVNMYHDHLQFCVVCINGRRYVCCNECYVVSDDCDEPTPDLCNLSERLCTLGVFAFPNCDDIYICVVKKQSELLEFLIPFMLTCSIIIFLSLLLLGLCA